MNTDDWRHPELREGEVFYSNIPVGELHWIKSWKTARIGEQAYDIAYHHMDGFVPVFVSIAEYDDLFGASRWAI